MDESKLSITLLYEKDEARSKALHQSLIAFNDAHSPHHKAWRNKERAPLEAYIEDEAGIVLGGLTAKYYWDWVYLDEFWLAETIRGQGNGRKLIRMVEEAALAKGVKWAMVQTFGFQARGFYEKEGYRVVGAVEDYPPGSCLYTLRKDFE